MPIVFFGDLFRDTARSMHTIVRSVQEVRDTEGDLSANALTGLSESMFNGMIAGQRMLEACGAYPGEASSVLATTPGAPADDNGNRTVTELQTHFAAIAAASSALNDKLEAFVTGPLAAVDLLRVETRTEATGLATPASGRMIVMTYTIPAAVVQEVRALPELTALADKIEGLIGAV